MRVLRLAALAAAVLFGGGMALQLSMPSGAPGAADQMYSVHTWWYMGRASGFVAFGLLLSSVLLGLGVSSRVFDGLLIRPWVYDMHNSCRSSWSWRWRSMRSSCCRTRILTSR